jgi:hypothetical protein
VTLPVVAVAGKVIVRLVAVAAETLADTLLNFTMLLAGVVEKLEPVMVTVVPTIPSVGVKPAIVGAGEGLSFLQVTKNAQVEKIKIIIFFIVF